VIQINQSFSSDTILTPFTGSSPVYSLSMSGGVNLYSDSSLVLVVLIDTCENHYLVFESYPLITTENMFDTLGACDETCFLDGVICDSLRIDIISAFLDLDSLKLDTNAMTNIPEMQAQAKWIRDSVKIAIMNQRIVEEKMYWRAGRTGLVQLSFHEKEIRFGKKFYGYGVEYYKGGIFEKLAKRATPIELGGYVGTFDWRDRHGAHDSLSPYWDGEMDTTGWITGIRNQEDCGICWLFSGVGTIEADLNLFYNIHDNEDPHHADVNIAEMDIWKRPDSYSNCTTNIGQIHWVLKSMIDRYRVNEDCFKYHENKDEDDCDIN
jgi:hypothetical protein